MQTSPYLLKENQCIALRRLVLLFLAQNITDLFAYTLLYFVYILNVYITLNNNSIHDTDGKRWIT